jgi:DNA polymerase III alpha subunit
MVVARQRPETANGIVFMLLEDERGNVNLIVPPPVYDRHRALVRSAPLLRAKGKLERREGTTNVVVTWVDALERTEKQPQRPAIPPLTGNNTSLTRSPPLAGGRDPSPRRRTRQLREHAVAELRAVAPTGHMFGRRG